MIADQIALELIADVLKEILARAISSQTRNKVKALLERVRQLLRHMVEEVVELAASIKNEFGTLVGDVTQEVGSFLWMEDAATICAPDRRMCLVAPSDSLQDVKKGDYRYFNARARSDWRTRGAYYCESSNSLFWTWSIPTPAEPPPPRFTLYVCYTYPQDRWGHIEVDFEVCYVGQDFRQIRTGGLELPLHIPVITCSNRFARLEHMVDKIRAVVKRQLTVEAASFR